MEKRKQLLRIILGIIIKKAIVTIIVLLILAGVSIATLMGDNGIITNANLAKK